MQKTSTYRLYLTLLTGYIGPLRRRSSVWVRLPSRADLCRSSFCDLFVIFVFEPTPSTPRSNHPFHSTAGKPLVDKALIPAASTQCLLYWSCLFVIIRAPPRPIPQFLTIGPCYYLFLHVGITCSDVKLPVTMKSVI